MIIIIEKEKAMKKFSKQRELILKNLNSRTDHPTAETLYLDLKQQMPEIGIATIYRNLSELWEQGEIIKIKSKTGPDRFDGNTKPHIHFHCDNCGQLLDISLQLKQMEELDNEIAIFANQIKALATSSEIIITGICKNCRKINK